MFAQACNTCNGIQEGHLRYLQGCPVSKRWDCAITNAIHEQEQDFLHALAGVVL